MTVATMQGLTPDLFGFVLCARCGTWRRPDGVVDGRCAEVGWCSAEVARKGSGSPASAEASTGRTGSIPEGSNHCCGRMAAECEAAPGPTCGGSFFKPHAGSPTGLDANGDAVSPSNATGEATNEC